jgi:hypothetical protein
MRAGGETMEASRAPFNPVIDEIARLTDQGLSPPDYFRELIRRALAAFGATAGAVWGASAANMPLITELNMLRVGLHDKPELKPSHDALLQMAREKAQPLVLSPGSGVGGAPDGTRPGNPTAFANMVVPVIVDGKPQYLLELWLDGSHTAEQHFRTVQMVVMLAGLASTYLKNHRIKQLTNQQELWGQLESFSQLIHASLKPLEVSYQVSNEGRRLVGCDRLSVAQRHGSRAVVEAVSGAEVVEKRSNLVRRLAELCDEVFKLNDKLVYTGAPDDTMPPRLRQALDAYLAESSSKVLIVLPIRDPREKDETKPSRSLLILECFETQTQPAQLLERLEVVGQHAASALYNADEFRRIPFHWIWRPYLKVQDGVGGKTQAIIAASIVGALALLAVFCFVPCPLKMDAKGQLLPEARAWVFTPAAGHVVNFEVEPNTEVREGQNLILMHDTELRIKLVNLTKEIEAAQKEIQACNARYEQARSNESERISISIERRKQEAIRDQKIDERNNLQSLTNSDEGKPGNFWVKSRMDGSVLNADFQENLRGKFVKPSDPLLRIGNCSGNWEIELKIPEKHVGQILEAFDRLGNDKELDVDLLLLSKSTRVFKGKLARHKIAGEASVRREGESEDTEPVVLATVRIEGDDIAPEDRLPRDLLLTGIEVHAKVRCGNRALGYSLFYGVWEFLYEKVIFAF